MVDARKYVQMARAKTSMRIGSARGITVPPKLASEKIIKPKKMY